MKKKEMRDNGSSECVCEERWEGMQGSLTKWLVASVKPKSCVREIPNWASCVFNDPERERTEDKSKGTDNTYLKYHVRCMGWLFVFFLSHCRLALTTTSRVENRSECSQMSRIEEWDVLCWGGGRWERGWNRGIDSSPSYPYCLWAHVGWTCWTPTERPADKEKERQQWRGIRARADKDRANSLCLCASACLSRMYTEVSVIPLAYTHAWHTQYTHNNNALYWTQTSVTSLPPKFNRNQLRLSKKGETYPPLLCPFSNFISTFLQIFISLLVLFLLYSHDSISTPLFVQTYI